MLQVWGCEAACHLVTSASLVGNNKVAQLTECWPYQQGCLSLGEALKLWCLANGCKFLGFACATSVSGSAVVHHVAHVSDFACPLFQWLLTAAALLLWWFKLTGGCQGPPLPGSFNAPTCKTATTAWDPEALLLSIMYYKHYHYHYHYRYHYWWYYHHFPSLFVAGLMPEVSFSFVIIVINIIIQ